MPNNGRIIDWASIEWKCGSTGSATGSGDGDATYGHSAEAYTQFTPDAIDTAIGIYLSAQSDFDGTSGSWQVLYDGPGAPPGGYIVGGSGFMSDVSISAIARDVKLYCKLTGSLWQLSWTQVDIYVNGAFDITLTGSAIDTASAGTGPNYVPLIGIPLYLTGGVSAGRANVPTYSYDACDPEGDLPIEWETQTTGGPYGGWRFQELGGDWISLPVTPYSGDAPSAGDCPFGLDLTGIIDVSETWDAAIACTARSRFHHVFVGRTYTTVDVTQICLCSTEEGTTETRTSLGTFNSYCDDPCLGFSQGYVDEFYTESESEGGSGSILLVPDLTRSIEKLTDDYRALWYRGTFPSATASLSHSCTDDGITTTEAETPEVYPAVSEFLACVGNADHAIEDPFAETIYAPTTIGKSQSYSKVFSYHAPELCACPPIGIDPVPCPGGFCVLGYECIESRPEVQDDISQSESVGLSFPATVGTGGGYQSHAVPLARYLATWPNPHWQFFFWREDWEVDGDEVPWADYWGLIREQWLYNVALPGGEQRETRNSLILSPIENENGNTPFLDTFAGGLRWIGVSRWITDEITLPSSLTLSEEIPGEWSAVDDECDIALDASGIICENFTAGTVSVELDIAQWNIEPFMLLHLAKLVQVGWGANVDSMTVLVVGTDGSTTTLGTTETTYELPQGAQSKYAGSWGAELGAGAVSDLGIDDDADGVSTATMSDPERAFAFQLGTGQTFAKLRFTITPTDVGDPVVISWPSFTFPTGHPKQYWENSKAQTWLWADSSGVRWGQWTFYIEGFGYQFPPVPTALGTANTIIDWLSFRRVALEGVHGLTGGTPDLTTELTQLYDTYEGQAVSVVDKHSHACPLPEKVEDATIRAALINSFSEVPPMACFPYRQRDDEWQPVGDYAQVVWDWTQETRNLISSDINPAKLTDDADNPVGAALSSPPNGWHIWQFAPELDNTESGWKIVTIDRTWAEVRPWHGWFCLLFGAPAPGANPWNLMSMIGQYHRTDVIDGEVWYRRATFSAPFGGFEHEGQVTSSGDCTHPRMEEDGRPVLYLIYIRDGVGLCIRASSDEGTTFGSETVLIADAYFPTIAKDPLGTLVALGFVYDSGTSGPGKVYMRRRGPGDTSWSASVAIQSGGVDMKFEPDTFHVSYDNQGPGRWVLVAKEEGASDVSEWYSTDECETFKAV